MNTSLLTCLFLTTSSLTLTAAEFQRAPYVQLATEDSMTLVWRTNKGISPIVRYGKSPDALTNILDVENIITRQVPSGGRSDIPLWAGHEKKMAPEDVVQYEAKVTGLKNHSRYYYAIYDGK